MSTINSNHLNYAYGLFYEALLSGGVDNIVKVAYKIFERPVVFTDEDYHLICRIPNQKIGNPI